MVIGHTDRLGTDEANDELSLQRAERVKADLVEQGIAAAAHPRRGPRRARAAGPTDDGIDEPLNRRVEINVR